MLIIALLGVENVWPRHRRGSVERKRTVYKEEGQIHLFLQNWGPARLRGRGYHGDQRARHPAGRLLHDLVHCGLEWAFMIDLVPSRHLSVVHRMRVDYRCLCNPPWKHSRLFLDIGMIEVWRVLWKWETTLSLVAARLPLVRVRTLLAICREKMTEWMSDREREKLQRVWSFYFVELFFYFYISFNVYHLYSCYS